MILPKIRVLHSHGRQAIPDLDAVELTPEFRGRPCLTETRDADDAEHAAAVCPTGAFTAAPLRSTWAAASSAANARASRPATSVSPTTTASARPRAKDLSSVRATPA